MNGWTVTVTHTIMSGQVARWYANPTAVVIAHEIISASRDGVMGGSGTCITPDLFAAAWAAHERLKRREDVRDIATHRYSMGDNEAVPIERLPDDTGSPHA